MQEVLDTSNSLQYICSVVQGNCCELSVQEVFYTSNSLQYIWCVVQGNCCQLSVQEVLDTSDSLHYIWCVVQGNCCQLSVQEVLDTSNLLIWRRTSREEQLLSERRRCSVWGITHYQMHSHSGTLVFPAASTIFHCNHPVAPVSTCCVVSFCTHPLQPSRPDERCVCVNSICNVVSIVYIHWNRLLTPVCRCHVVSICTHPSSSDNLYMIHYVSFTPVSA